MLQHVDSERALPHLRQAVALEPQGRDYRLALIHALGRSDDGLEEAYQLLRPMLAGAAGWAQNDLHIAFHVLSRVCAYDELDALGDPFEIGRKWAEAGNHTALFLLLGRAVTPEQKAALVELHRIAAARMEAGVTPLNPPPCADDPIGPAPASL